MKLIITTVYDNIDDDWMSWYIGRMANDPDIVAAGVLRSLTERGQAQFVSSNPDNPDEVATTTYRVVRL